jgi:hypothetical protein
MSKLELGKVVAAIGLIGALAGLSGCSGSDEGEAGGISTSTAHALSGVYELTHISQNQAGCDAEGQSVFGQTQDRHFVLVSRVVLGNRVLMLVSCSGIEDCRQKRRAIESSGSYHFDYSFMLTSEIDATHVAGFEASTGYGDDAGMCTERVYSDHDLVLRLGGVRLESRTKVLADQPQKDGACWVTPAESRTEAAGVPCSELRVLEGSKVEGPD